MTKEELKRLVEHETQWLKYYMHFESKKTLHFNDHLFYDRVKSIGYTKRVVPLDRRCTAAILTSPKDVLTEDLSKIEVIGFPRDHSKNAYTPLEVWIIKFPQERTWALQQIIGE